MVYYSLIGGSVVAVICWRYLKISKPQKPCDKLQIHGILSWKRDPVRMIISGIRENPAASISRHISSLKIAQLR